MNVDCDSLASDDTPQFEGYIAQGMILRGENSGARARVTNVRLIPDQNGTLIGTFHVPNSSSSANPIFETGTSTFRLTGSPLNSDLKGDLILLQGKILFSRYCRCNSRVNSLYEKC